ncbi:TfoX/Sxy family protein [Rhodococcus erythropolis]|jgi:TfoX/Sxy family transcriptional regulator of competence genes|uniref:TfoX/Sxy family protein n=1 Tax=Rhodococcus baikonurensis TaxID=172041 RepID=A0ABV5XN71_9NOCA|nr:MULTISPECIES: TfoX/Sxy family protein [unclassified Rhodococcus (in: high G+C Gram-positive bacteria)]MBJ7480705.1 TfoX/Sxy family protein [Rhodococcus sp. (in: high G+C Gram-positive bacteria)]NHP14159.1 TfoX/Sxy family protein [Rhodococcus sp. IC4_135]QQM20971.1 TfoX/Sxy family protein [Rhodococcus sp. P-2]
MAYDKALAERIRDALSGEDDVEEVKMFGGLSFMVNGKLAASANSHGNIMVRCDPDRVDELLTHKGASWPEMRGKPMSKGWIVVDRTGTSSNVEFDAWIKEALDFVH